MKTQHTPGPWKLETVKTSSGICHKIGPFPWRPNKENYACVYVDYPSNGPVEAELLANAHLIASAPELLAVLQKVEAACRDALDLLPGETVGAQYLLDIVSPALARATPPTDQKGKLI